MYVYIYDDSIIKNEKLLHRIEKRLTDLGLNGQVVKPGISRDLKTTIADKIKQGAKTIVAVGTDEIVSKTINIIANNQSDEKHHLTLGIIPVDDKNCFIANSFGIKNVDDACKILLARRLEEFRLAHINDGFFLFNTVLKNSISVILEINRKYTVQSSLPAEIKITNIPEINSSEQKDHSFLKTSIINKEGETVFFSETILAISKDGTMIVDNGLAIPAPALIKPSEQTLRVIVGKHRNLNN